MTSLQQPDSSQSTFLLHGVFAVRDQQDGYALVEVQQGVVTVLDVGSITVTSPDGFAKSYPLPADRADQLSNAVGSRVTVMVDAQGRTLVEIGEPPVDGSDTSALIPISTHQHYVSADAVAPAALPSAAEPPTAAR